ncbi:hypothetical protein ES705_48280 [subsurface metagenome]
MLTVRGTNNGDGSFNWRGNLVDALILAALTFFVTMGGLSATGLVSERELIAAAIAAATQFCLTLTIKRGLREKGSVGHEEST